jgi:hypothetical protein
MAAAGTVLPFRRGQSWIVASMVSRRAGWVFAQLAWSPIGGQGATSPNARAYQAGVRAPDPIYRGWGYTGPITGSRLTELGMLQRQRGGHQGEWRVASCRTTAACGPYW